MAEPSAEDRTDEPRTSHAPRTSDAPDAGEGRPADSKTRTLPAIVPARAVRFADGVLTLVAVLFAINFMFAVQLHRKPQLKAAALAGFAAFVGVRLLLGPARRLTLALSVLPAVIALSVFEAAISRARPRPGTAASKAGRPFDSRTKFEVLRDVRKEDPTAQSFIFPRGVLTRTLDVDRAGDADLEHTVREGDWGVEVGGARVLPLGGVSSRKTVFCNESGTWALYDSDERGFNNPRGIWGKAPLDVVILGDSFSQGACVPQEKNTASRVRQRYPKTLTLGMSSNGPLTEYAALKEYVVDLRPKIVLWQFYNNDFSDMDIEAQSSLLRRYLDDDGFRQGLAERQPGIDKALDEYLDSIEPKAPRWPGALAAIGLTRASAPLLLQDIVMGESNTASSAVLRLDNLSSTIATRLFETNYLQAPPNKDLFRHVLLKAKATVEGWGGKMYFVYAPDLFFLPYRGKRENPRRQEVLRTVEEVGLPLIDVHAAFLALPDPEFRYHHESHVNEEGYAKIAEAMLAGIEKDPPR